MMRPEDDPLNKWFKFGLLLLLILVLVSGGLLSIFALGKARADTITCNSAPHWSCDSQAGDVQQAVIVYRDRPWTYLDGSDYWRGANIDSW